MAVNIIVVGGGVIGLSVARSLATRGVKDILVIERGQFGREASFAAAGMLAPQAEANECDAFFRLAIQSRDLYFSFAHSLLEETGIDVELDTTGTLYLAFTPQDLAEVNERFDWQDQAGLAIEKLTSREVRSLEPSVSDQILGGLRFRDDVQVENRQLVQALILSCSRHGVSLLPDTTVNSLRVRNGRLEGVDTSRGFFGATTVVIAGGAWSSRIEGLPEIPIEPVRGQMLCFKAGAVSPRHVLYSPRGYIVPRRDLRLLAGSTAERVGFDKSISEPGLRAITSHAVEISPGISSLPLLDSWAGLRPRAPDDLPVLGPCGEIEGLVYATGHYRNGILLAPATGDLIAETIINDQLPPLLTPFSANRFGLVPVSR